MTTYAEEYPEHIVHEMNAIRSELVVKNAQPWETYNTLFDLQQEFIRSMNFVCRNWLTDPQTPYEIARTLQVQVQTVLQYLLEDTIAEVRTVAETDYMFETCASLPVFRKYEVDTWFEMDTDLLKISSYLQHTNFVDHDDVLFESLATLFSMYQQYPPDTLHQTFAALPKLKFFRWQKYAFFYPHALQVIKTNNQQVWKNFAVLWKKYSK